MMEGNLSISQAKAAVAKTSETAEPSFLSDEKNLDKAAWGISQRRRRNLLLFSILASALWLIGCAGALFWAQTQGSIQSITPADIGGLVGAAGVPLCLIWIVALVMQRSDPLLELPLAIARTLQQSIAPVDAAEVKLDRLLERLQRDVGTVDQTVGLASERIKALEDRFQSQVSELFSATTDAEAKATTISDQLRRERESVEGLIETLTAHLGSMKSTLEVATEKTLSAELTSREAFDASTKAFTDQRTEMVTAFKEGREALNQSIDGLAERTTAMDAAALAASQKLGKSAAALKAHEAGYRKFVDDFAADFQAFDATIDDRLSTLRAAQDTLSVSGTEIGGKIGNLAQSASDTIQHILGQSRSFTEALETQEEAMQARMDAALESFDTAQVDLLQRYELFKEGAETLGDDVVKRLDGLLRSQTETTQSLFSQLSDHTQTWTAQVGSFEERLSESTQRAGDLAAAHIQDAQAKVDAGLETFLSDVGTRFKTLEVALADQTSVFSSGVEHVTNDIAQREKSLSGTLQAFTSTGEAVAQKLNTAQAMLAGTRGALGGEIDSYVGQLNAARDALSQQTGQIATQAQTVSTLSRALGTGWSKAFRDAQAAARDLAKSYQAQVEQIETTSEHFSAFESGIGAKIEASVQQLESFEKRLAQSVEAARGQSKGFAKTGDEITGALSQIDTDIQAAQGRLDDLRSSLEKAAGADLDVSPAIAALEGKMAEFSEAATALRSKAEEDASGISRSYLDTLARARSILSDTGSAAQETSKTIAAAADKAIELVRLKWSTTSQERQHEAAKQFEDLSARITEQMTTALSQIQDATTQAEKNSLQTLSALREETDKTVVMSQERLKHVQALTSRVENLTTSDLIRSSSLIIDALNSLSIDIGKSMSSDLSDADWSQYLSGDKSVFTRKALKFLDRSKRNAIRNRTQSDAEFKETVFRYLKDFELLMSRAMKGAEPTALSVALISSDLGKLYVVLSQSLRRLN